MSGSVSSHTQGLKVRFTIHAEVYDCVSKTKTMSLNIPASKSRSFSELSSTAEVHYASPKPVLFIKVTFTDVLSAAECWFLHSFLLPKICRDSCPICLRCLYLLLLFEVSFWWHLNEAVLMSYLKIPHRYEQFLYLDTRLDFSWSIRIVVQCVVAPISLPVQQRASC